jgi:hypothetical protein
LESLLENEGLNADTILYRYTSSHHIITADDGNTFIKANPNPPEIVVDHYAQGHSMPAREFGPGLAFALSKENRFKSSEKKCVSIRLGDILNQGGKLYQDQSSGEPDSWFMTMPQGSVNVIIVS